MPATAAEATRAHPAATDSDPPSSPRGRERDAQELEWSEVVRVLTATDEDDVPLFGRLPA